MTLDEAFIQLGLQDREHFTEAMQCVLDEWDHAALRCRTMLRGYVAGTDYAEATERALHPILHILAEKLDTGSFADICALIADPERADLILGEAIIDTLPCILISCYAGDPAPLQAVIDQPDGDPLVRQGSLLAMAYLAQAKQLPRATMHAYLTALHDRIPPEPDVPLWLGWVSAVALLGFRALFGQAAAVFERKLIAPEFMRLEDFRADARFALEDPASFAGFLDLGIGPLGSAIAAMDDEDGDGAPVETPFVNPLRAIGRNDPCPCGSGKKYKKCCLA